MIPTTPLLQGNTLLLDRDTWDLVVDSDSNIAVCASPYATAQDAASSCRTFTEECWYDMSRGVPYFEQVFGKLLSSGIYRSALTREAMRVPNVTAAVVYFAGVDKTRKLIGQIQVTVVGGAVIGASL